MLTAEEISQGLDDLGELLFTKKFIKDISPLKNAKHQFRNDRTKYVVSGLEFKTAQGEFIRGGIWDQDVDIKMSAEVSVEEAFEFSSAQRMIINLEYSCWDKDVTKECRGCWHMDYHVEPGNPPKYMHPDFHIHHGGRKLNDLDDYGKIALLDNPRVMHNPLDVFLGIDFIISNFYPENEWKKLRADQRYERLIKAAQENWWRPYYLSLADYWQHKDNKKSKESQQVVNRAKRLNPHFV
tara:strand:+ start:6909 stop:7625 length:717 start_codon:yes stop_codon:yes gene_type:complete